jgi:3-methyl-2-oxobutanoate hydroxymethyltransferase
MKKLTTKHFRNYKKPQGGVPLKMLTAYDYPTARLLNESAVDMILVGDSLGNVVLGYDTTIQVTIEEMLIFSKAVRRGAPDKFLVVDLPFGTYATKNIGIKNALRVFQETQCEAVKIEGGHKENCRLIETLTKSGVAVVGHIGLTPQSIHEQGGYYMHGQDNVSVKRLLQEAKDLQNAGAFCLVVECVNKELSKTITQALKIPTIGIGSGIETDGQVLVINDLLGLGDYLPPKFVKPIANLFQVKKDLIGKYLETLQ